VILFFKLAEMYHNVNVLGLIQQLDRHPSLCDMVNQTQRTSEHSNRILPEGAQRERLGADGAIMLTNEESTKHKLIKSTIYSNMRK
jgi:hypothetical protein